MGVSLNQPIRPIAEYMNDNLKAAMNPEYEELPESIKMLHTPEQYAWLGDARYRIIERETQPDMDYSE